MPNEEKGESLSYFLNEHNLNPYTVSPIFQDSHRKWRIWQFSKAKSKSKNAIFGPFSSYASFKITIFLQIGQVFDKL